MPPVGGIPLDCFDPTSDIPSEFSRWASIVDHSLGIPDSGARDRLSNPFGGQPATSQGFCGCVPWLTWEGRGRGCSPFCPLGVSFQAGAVAALCWRRIRSAPSVRRKKTVRRRIYGGVTSFVGSVRWWVVAYKYPTTLPVFSLPPSASILAFAPSP